jgi:hypothetical protein
MTSAWIVGLSVVTLRFTGHMLKKYTAGSSETSVSVYNCVSLKLTSKSLLSFKPVPIREAYLKIQYDNYTQVFIPHTCLPCHLLYLRVEVNGSLNLRRLIVILLW